MPNHFIKRRIISVLLVLAMMVATFVALVPLTASADAPEISDLGVQPVRDLNLASDGSTNLRFLFKINKLTYSEVGFVFSKTNRNPTVGGENCTKISTNKAYSSVNANGSPLSAGANHWWVVIQMNTIPRSFFDGAIYVNAYVKDGSGIRYSENPATATVCVAKNHTHTVSTPDYTVPASVISNEKKVGTCSVCGLDNVTVVTNTAFTPAQMKFKKTGTAGQGYTKGSFDPNVKISTIRGSDHFHPTVGYPNGKDFYFEVDMLWNPTMLNIPDGELIRLLFWNDYREGDDENYYNAFFTLTPKDNNKSSGLYCLHRGGFDYSSGKALLDGPAAGWQVVAWDQYPNLGASPTDPQYGWHRIAVRIHQDAAIDNGEVVYSGVSYLYIDGLQRWKIDLNMDDLEAKGNLLYTATIENDKLVYHDNPEDDKRYCDFWTTKIQSSTTEVDMVFRPAVGRLVDPDTFDTGVIPVYNPPAASFTLQNGDSTSAKVYFAEKTVELFDSKKTGQFHQDGMDYTFAKTVAQIRGDENFYPDSFETHAQGKDLWFEYSFLFNDSLNNFNTKNYASEIKTFAFRSGDTHKEFYLLYGQNYADRVGDNKGKTGDKCAPDCKFRGHFDYSTYLEGCNQNCADDLTSLGNNLFGDAVGRYAAGWSDDGNDRTASPYVYDNNDGTIKGYNGWHRLGFRYHQEVASVAGDTVTYEGYTELYINGTLVWRVHTNMQGNAEKSLKENGLLLWTATAENGVITGYTNNDAMKVECRIGHVTASSNSVFVAVDDPIWTIGGTGLIRPTTDRR
ncbi:MAG: hypothetical protein J5958_04095 [Clostridia bacterium]|nr:hypothetical protein [Clostridia bacterium]